LLSESALQASFAVRGRRTAYRGLWRFAFDETKRIILLTVLCPGQYGLGVFGFAAERETFPATSLSTA